VYGDGMAFDFFAFLRCCWIDICAAQVRQAIADGRMRWLPPVVEPGEWSFLSGDRDERGYPKP